MGPPSETPSLKGNSDLPISKALESVLGLLTAMNFKRVSESTFFQSNKFTACKVKDGKEAAKSFNGLQSTEDYSPSVK